MTKNWFGFYSKWIVSVLMLVTVLGCSGVAFEPDAPGEMSSGPGVFTKESGEFTLYSSEKGEQQGSAPASGSDAEKALTSETEVRETAAGQPAAASAIPSSASGAGDYKEFELWKEYQEWKRSNPDTQDFEDWKKWKEYQEWKNSQ